MRLSARSRLTLLYTGLVLAAGVVLTALTYLLMRQNLAHRIAVVQLTGPGAPGDLPPLAENPSEVSRQLRDEALNSLLTQAGIALAAVTVLAAVLGWLVAGRVLRPIRAISATAQRLSAENLSARVPVHPPHDELAALAATVNGMLDRIQRGIAERDQALDSQRLFTANAAHELRTPLTTIRAAIDVTLDGEPTRDELLTMAQDVHTAADDSRRTIDGLLALARSQSGVRSPRPVDLAAVAAAALAAAADQLSAMDIRVRRDLRAAPVLGEPVLLERLTANLVGNAIRYNHAGGDITVATGTATDAAFLRVHNTGRTVPADHVDRLLEPFVRGEGSRTTPDGGAGLGLSIVRAVVTAHRGEITTTANPEGGLDITVRLPRASSSPCTDATCERAPRGQLCGMDTDTVADLRRFVLDRLAEDQARADREELPLLDEAERRGRLRFLRADEGGLLLVPGTAEAQDEQVPVPFAEKAALLREELVAGADEPTLRLLAEAYDTHHGWQEEWRQA